MSVSVDEPKITFKLKKKSTLDLPNIKIIRRPKSTNPTTTTTTTSAISTNAVTKPKTTTAKTTRTKKTTPEVNTSKRLVFIDASFFIFYRYTATKVWYTTHKKKEGNTDIDNAEFVAFYDKFFTDWVTKITKKFKADHVYWFKDQPLETLWRLPLLSDYKGTREKKCPPEISAFFKRSYELLIPKERVISIPQAEADDGVDIAVKYENREHPDNKIVVVTGDTDYIQLINDITRVVQLPKLDDMRVEFKINKKEKIKTTPAIYIKAKILAGDACDEVTKVYSGCGPRTAFDIAQSEDMFQRLIADHPERLEKYNLNKKIMLFDEIPTDIRQIGEAIYKAISSTTN